MPDYEAIEVLTQAKGRIMEHGWGTGTTTSRSLLRDDETTYCIEEGLCRQRGEYINKFSSEPEQRAAGYVRTVLGLTDKWELYMWNDSRAESANDVFVALDNAILLAKES